MEINKHTAQSIVDSMKEIIRYDINFINKKGMIIASTDENRIGQEHFGAKLCMQRKEDLIIDSDDLYKGSKKGINMLIQFEQEIMGVIGITGEPSEIDKYGRIIKKMTEILIYEDWFKTTNMKRKENIRIAIEGLLLGSGPKGLNLFSEGDESIKYVVTIVWDKQNLDLDKIYNKIKGHIDLQKENYIAQFYNEIVIVLSSILKEELAYLIENISKSIKKYGDFYIGIGSSYTDETDLKKSYQEAKASLKWNSIYNNDTSISFYEDLDLGLLFNNITASDIDLFTNAITQKIPRKDLALYHELILSYSKYNGQITKMADELFIHKNTVQYRLNRLNELTGYNPRNIVDFVKLYLAFSMLKLKEL